MNYVTFYHNSITIHQLKSSPLHILLIKKQLWKGTNTTKMQKGKAHILGGKITIKNVSDFENGLPSKNEVKI